MDNVLTQAEQLAEAILESEEYIKMRIAEQAAMRDGQATGLIEEYSQCRDQVESLLAQNDLDHDALAKAGEKLKDVEERIGENTLIQTMRVTNAAFTGMMQQVNKIIKYVVTGEMDEASGGCSGSCASCGSGCQH